MCARVGDESRCRSGHGKTFAVTFAVTILADDGQTVVSAEASSSEVAAETSIAARLSKILPFSRLIGGGEKRDKTPAVHWKDAVDQIKSTESFRRGQVLRRLNGLRTRRARALRKHSKIRLFWHAVLMLGNLAMFVLDSRLRPRPDPMLLTIAARSFGRADDAISLWINSSLGVDINVTAAGAVDFGDYSPVNTVYSILLIGRTIGFMLLLLLWYGEMYRNVDQGVLFKVLVSPPALALVANLAANLALGCLIAAMETQFAGAITWVQCLLNNGLHFFGFLLLMATDAMIEKTRELRRLWFFIALLLSIYNLFTRTVGNFANEAISLSTIAQQWSSSVVGEEAVANLLSGSDDITVQAARRTIDYTLVFLTGAHLMSVAFNPDLLCFLKVTFTLRNYKHFLAEKSRSRSRERTGRSNRSAESEGGSQKKRLAYLKQAFAKPGAGSGRLAALKEAFNPHIKLANLEALATGGVEATRDQHGHISDWEEGGGMAPAGSPERAAAAPSSPSWESLPDAESAHLIQRREWVPPVAFITMRPPSFMGPPSRAPMGAFAATPAFLPPPAQSELGVRERRPQRPKHQRSLTWQLGSS